MKKIYIHPTTTVLTIATQQILAESDPKVSICNDGSMDPDDFGVKAHDHSYSIWDDDWSE